MIDVARIDYWAASGSGPFYRASVMSKMLFFLFVVGASMYARSPLPLASGYAALALTAALTGLPWLRMAALSLYAAVFALLYAASLRGSAEVFFLYILKAVIPSFAVLMLVVSTPYPRILSFLGGYMPEILAAGLIMTYRTFFILLDMMDSFITAIRIRGGFSPGSLYKNGANISKGIGMLLVKAVERSSRLYAVMRVRGYSGSMTQKDEGGLSWRDWPPLLTGAAVLAIVMLWK